MIPTPQKRAYWQYQYRLGKEYLIPLLREWGILLQGRFVLDICCAEGGVLCAMAEEGARALGLEISPSRLALARSLAAPRHLQHLTFVAADFHRAPLQLSRRAPDLILLRDVFEHLENKQKVMADLAALMGEHTRLMITFPPFYSPFGGHQQMLGSFLRKVPYFHALPQPAWKLLRWFIARRDRNAAFLHEMEKLRRHRITIGQFYKMAELHGLRIVKKRLYLIRPSHHLRYGWPVISANGMGGIPVLREFLISAGFFLIEKERV